MLVAKEEHERDGVVELVHLLEVWHLIDVADVDYCKIFYAVRDTYKALPAAASAKR